MGRRAQIDYATGERTCMECGRWFVPEKSRILCERCQLDIAAQIEERGDGRGGRSVRPGTTSA